MPLPFHHILAPQRPTRWPKVDACLRKGPNAGQHLKLNTCLNVCLGAGLWAALVLLPMVAPSAIAQSAQTTEPFEPIDVPITRGTINLGSIRPSLGPSAPPPETLPAGPQAGSGTPAAAAAASAAPDTATGRAPRQAPTTAAAPAPGPSPAALPNPPRTVADFAAIARARAAAEAAAANANGLPPKAAAPAVPTTPSSPPTEPTPPAAPPAAAATSPTASTLAPAPPPARAAAPTPRPAPAPRLRTPTQAQASAEADTGMQNLANKIMEAMSRAEAKQGGTPRAQSPANTARTARSPRTAPQPVAGAAATTAPSQLLNGSSSPTATEPAASHSRDELKARAAALAAKLSGNEEVFLDAPRWSYGGQTGPAHWHRLRPSYELCATGQRQAPIAIDSSTTLQGPAEPLDIRYEPVDASVWHTGRTLQVDVAPGNLLTVRGIRYELTALRFQHPGEGSINGVTHPMSVQLWHRSDTGDQLVLSIPLQVGSANAAIHTLWTYLPLDTDDRVRLPPAALNVAQLLPPDLRYFQFMGSLPTPPCTEDVLWLVMKTPATLSTAQLTLFGQMFPLSARPPQPTHERPVREAL